MLIGGVGVVAVFSRITDAMSRVACTSGFTQAVLGGFSQDFQQNMDRLSGDFARVGNQFAFAAVDVQQAFGVITRESRSANVELSHLEAAMGLARITGSDLAASSTTIGQAMLGNIEPLRAALGEIGSVDDAFQRLRAGGLTATTELDQGRSFIQQQFDRLGEGINDFLDSSAGQFLKNLLEMVVESRIGQIKFVWSGVGKVFDIAAWLFDNRGRGVPFVLDFLANLPGWLKSVLDWVSERTRTADLQVNWRSILPSWANTALDWVAAKTKEVNFSVLWRSLLPSWANAILDWVVARVKTVEIRLSFPDVRPQWLKDLWSSVTDAVGQTFGGMSPVGGGSGITGPSFPPGTSGLFPPGQHSPNFPTQNIFDFGLPRQLTPAAAPTVPGLPAVAAQIGQQFDSNNLVGRLVPQLERGMQSVFNAAVSRGTTSNPNFTTEQLLNLARQGSSQTIGDIMTSLTATRDTIADSFRHYQSQVVRWASEGRDAASIQQAQRQLDASRELNIALNQLAPVFSDALRQAQEAGLARIQHDRGLLGLASGGIVTRPTLAMVGEAGPEAVVPLNGSMGMGTTINITINGDVDNESRVNELALKVRDALFLNQRRGLAF